MFNNSSPGLGSCESSPAGCWLLAAGCWLLAAGCISAAEAQQYDSSKDFDTLIAAGNTAPTGIWSDGRTMWVADSAADKIFAYNLNTKARDGSQDFNNTLSAARNNNPLGIWSDRITMWVADGADSKIYAYNLNTKAYDGSKDFNDTLKGAGNNVPSGIWSDRRLGGTTMWVADYTGGKIYAYNLNTKAYDRDKDFNTLNRAGNNVPFGIWLDRTTMWVADSVGSKIYAYNLASKAYVYNFTLAVGNTSPAGIWSDGATMWVADSGARKIYAYRMPALPPPQAEQPQPPQTEQPQPPPAEQPPPPAEWTPPPPSECRVWVLKIPPLGPGECFWTPSWTTDSSSGPSHSGPSTSGPSTIGPSTSGSSSTTGPSTSGSSSLAGLFLPRDTTPPTVVSVVRAGNATTADRALVWNVTFSEPVVVRPDVHFNRTSAANATIPDLGAVSDAMLVDVPGAVTGGSVSVDLHHYITSDLLIELVAPDCTRFLIHNQTTTFLYMLRQPLDLGDLAGVGAGGWWTLHVSDHEKFWNGTLNAWTLTLESDGAVEGGGAAYAITRHVAGPGNHTLNLDGYDIRDRAGNPLADADPGINEPYRVVGAATRTCQAG